CATTTGPAAGPGLTLSWIYEIPCGARAAYSLSLRRSQGRGGQGRRYGVGPACRRFTMANDSCTCWSGRSLSASDDSVATTLPSLAITNVVRGKNMWPISTPRVSFAPGLAGAGFKSYVAATLPSGSDATGNLPAQ